MAKFEIIYTTDLLRLVFHTPYLWNEDGDQTSKSLSVPNRSLEKSIKKKISTLISLNS